MIQNETLNCGLFALASDTALDQNGKEPCSYVFDQKHMRPHLIKCFEAEPHLSAGAGELWAVCISHCTRLECYYICLLRYIDIVIQNGTPNCGLFALASAIRSDISVAVNTCAFGCSSSKPCVNDVGVKIISSIRTTTLIFEKSMKR